MPLSLLLVDLVDQLMIPRADTARAGGAVGPRDPDLACVRMLRVGAPGGAGLAVRVFCTRKTTALMAEMCIRRIRIIVILWMHTIIRVQS